MAKLVILGTASAIPDAAHENTHMLLSGENGSVLIDSGASPMLSLKRAGVDLDRLQALIVTHFHPDHVSGLPILLLDLWLLGRKRLLTIHGLAGTLSKVQQMMNLFEWTNWPGFYPVSFEPVSATENAPLLDTPDFHIVATPTHHLVPSIGIKVTAHTSGRTMVYSSDTSPCDSIIRLAHRADLLVHEGTGAQAGHTSPSMAGSIARQAQVKQLALVHYHYHRNIDELILEARSTFDGPASVMHDMDEFEL